MPSTLLVHRLLHDLPVYWHASTTPGMHDPFFIARLQMGVLLAQ
jgi:hypothetical protein